MNLRYNGSVYPSVRHREAIINAAGNLFRKFSTLDIDSLAISDYTKQYLWMHRRALRSSMQRFSYLLHWALARTDVSLEDFVFVDYGGGTGIYSLLSKLCGIGTVIYVDIFDQSCKDACVIAKALGLEANYYVCGELDELIQLLEKESLLCHAISSFDVIEHIYDIVEFVRKLGEIPNQSLSVVMGSAANSENPLKRRSLKKFHLQVEFQNRQSRWGHKQRDSQRAYYDIREEIITNDADSLSEKEVERLSSLTRGMIRADIQNCVQRYLESGELPNSPEHPTNTCDPVTGNWAEHLMDIGALRDKLNASGFHARILHGYYGTPNHVLGPPAAWMLNKLILLLSRKSLVLAPYFILYGFKEREES